MLILLLNRINPGLSAKLRKSLLTAQETVVLMKVSEVTVRKWIHEEELRAIKFARWEWRIAVRDLEAFINERATRPPSSLFEPTGD